VLILSVIGEQLLSAGAHPPCAVRQADDAALVLLAQCKRIEPNENAGTRAPVGRSNLHFDEVR
jgi:hypothetical protein